MEVRPETFYMICNNIKRCASGKIVKEFITYFIPPKLRVHAGHLEVFKKICILYNNKHFTLNEYILYLLVSEIYKEDSVKNPYEWELDEIGKMSKVLGDLPLKKDQEFILQLSKKAKLNSIEDFFTINSDGSCIAFDLTKKKYISPSFVVKYSKHIKDNSEESLETKRVKRIIEAMIKIKNKDNKNG